MQFIVRHSRVAIRIWRFVDQNKRGQALGTCDWGGGTGSVTYCGARRAAVVDNWLLTTDHCLEMFSHFGRIRRRNSLVKLFPRYQLEGIMFFSCQIY